MVEGMRVETPDLLRIKIPKNADVDKLVSFAKFVFEKDQPLQRRFSATGQFENLVATVVLLLRQERVLKKELERTGLPVNFVKDRAISIVRKFAILEGEKSARANPIIRRDEKPVRRSSDPSVYLDDRSHRRSSE